tara:strand:+ start:760 stop:1254 length:495 start_codon:yes stop_codon:yes gene_type:complete
MHIVIKNNILTYDNNSIPCVIGRNGCALEKKEGDGCTPVGKFNIIKGYYRSDKVKTLFTKIELSKINRNSGWCDDPNCSLYNQYINFPFDFSAENLYRNDDLYDILFVIDYNINPVEINKGSAIFLHVAHKDFSPTEGCIAIEKEKLIELSRVIDKHTTITIKI